MALSPPLTLSPSKVASFKDCALAFRFSAIDRLPEPPSEAAVKGTVVHRALQLLLWEPPPARTLGRALEALEQAGGEAEGWDDYRALALDDEAAERFHRSAEELVRRYFELEDPTRVRPIGFELQLEARVGGLRLRGIIDRLELGPDGELVVTDYKTGKAPGPQQEQRRLGGVHFYALLCQEVLGRRPARVQLLYLAEPLTIVAQPSERSLRGWRRQLSALWSAVERACQREDFRPNPSRLCDWCAFRAYCPAFGGDPAQARSELPLSLPAPA